MVPNNRVFELLGISCYSPGMRPFVHPVSEDISLSGVLHALADPARLAIFQRLLAASVSCPTHCAALAPESMARSTQSFHFQVLREAGLIRSVRRGAEVINSARCEEVDARFPGLLTAILSAGAAPTPVSPDFTP